MERYVAETDAYRSIPIQKELSLAGKTVVVTGGARGLGLAIAHGCAELGANIAVIDMLPEPSPDLKHLDDLKVKWKFYNTDITDTDGLESTFKDIVSVFGSIDGLVNGAGTGGGSPFVEFERARMQRIVGVNVLGTMAVTQLATQQMVKQGRGGAVVSISSIGGHVNIPGQTNAPYSASKGAILSFTKALAVELADRNIRVNSVSPGFFLTKITPGYLAGDVERLMGFENSVPMGRFADRRELKSVVAFLLTSASSYITGQDLAVDGGVLAGRGHVISSKT
ncbi:hypothetical protein A1O1_01490 [Capronia coronata CBS 617.96]|uniref:Gluconate 5-dehydrogenase n=1 Tax=Capronia coronata CBS 617.96 TaxID=1182541 RepID=W9ZPI5_9EURO|nr:uncharacterized protein A1O1_01490 [Capronia coronata CBS 617.96]EXJ96364.1 hypothetical protein A1O1_01490 [Capronia coronata CBS 617.96]